MPADAELGGDSQAPAANSRRRRSRRAAVALVRRDLLHGLADGEEQVFAPRGRAPRATRGAPPTTAPGSATSSDRRRGRARGRRARTRAAAPCRCARAAPARRGTSTRCTRSASPSSVRPRRGHRSRQSPRAARTSRGRRSGGAAAGARPPRAWPRSRRPARSTSSRFASASTSMTSPSRRIASGPPTAASGEMWPTEMPCVPPPKRPSVSSAVCSTSPAPTIADVRWVISGIPGPALRALVADDDDVARHDPAVGDGAERLLLGVEDPRRAAVPVGGLVRDLDHRAVRGEVAPEDRVAAGLLDRILDSVQHRRPRLGRASHIRRAPRPSSAPSPSARRRRSGRHRAARASRPARRPRRGGPAS